MNYLPIRKVLLAAVAFGITFALRAVGVDLGPELVNELALGAITLGTAYAVKDSRVKTVAEAAEGIYNEAAAFAKSNPGVAAIGERLYHTVEDRYGDKLHIEEVVDKLYASVQEDGEDGHSIDVALDDAAVRELVTKLTGYLARKA